ncbi:MAG TPA: cysteine desulfurase NifS [Candidatus Latescibacteria bacterium]|nr:cysteine desulfurase NifS [Candidatus Latescibacterota bacterium]
MRRVYLDNNATTPVHPLVLEAMIPFFKETFGNASSVHYFGQQAKKALEESREKVAAFIGAKAGEIVFTSGGTESDNLAIKGVAYANRAKGRHIITSSIEHHAVLNVCKQLEKKGFEVTYLPVNRYGEVSPESVEDAIRPDTILITVMHANNEVGTLQPIDAIGKIAKARQILFHTDAVQSVGKVPVNVDSFNVDLLSLSSHKIYGPKGVGALYVRRGTRILPLFQGGHHERRRRAGTENVPGVVGLGRACELAAENMDEEAGKLLALMDRLQSGLERKVEDVLLNGHPTKRLPNTLNMSFAGVEGESLLLNLDMEGIAVSTGSACTSGTLEPSHVLSAMGVDPQLAQGSLRFSLGRENTEEDIDYVLAVISDIVKRLRAISPFYKSSSSPS